jgi:copper chaperone CopZ
VEQVKVGSATVAFDPATTTEARIAEAVETKGYRVAATTR